MGGVRHSHGDNLTDYIDQIRKDGKVLQMEDLSDTTRAWEKLMLGFRTSQGVLKSEVDAFAKSKGISYGDKFSRLLKEGFLSLREERFQVTSKGYFVLNGILEVLAA